jgi:DNA-binding CsgD family transcriptional regulator/tetratricopeptide (TPR) repeat protein
MERTITDPAGALVGRQRELATLWAQFEEAGRGRPRVALIGGEPGIGKTRLLNALASRAAAAGALVLRGGASDAEGMPPYLPFLEALGAYIRATPPDIVRAQADRLAPILATILPELPRQLGDLPASYPLPPEQARLRLFEAVSEFLATIAARCPLLLILDDLHWADPASLDLLCFAARQQHAGTTPPQLLVLGAYREGEVAGHPAFERALNELNRLRVLSTVMPGPLAGAEVAALAASQLGTPLDAAASRLLASQSEGNPFFAEELLRGWVEGGAVARRGSVWSLVAPGAPPLPPGIAGAVRQRLNRLPAATVELLCTAAIIGRTFTIALLAEAAGQEPEAAEDRLRDAVRARLLRPDGPETFAFSHDTIRECLYDEVTAIRRRRLHGVIGQALEAQTGAADPQRLAELAFHFARSGDRARGATYARRAAEQATRAYALEEAVIQYQAALDLLDAADSGRGALLLGLGDAALLAGDAGQAIAAFAEAQEWFTRTGATVEAARAAHGLGRASWQREAIPQAEVAFATARALLAERPVPETVAVLVDLGSLLALSLHRQDEGLACVRQAVALAEQIGEPRSTATASRALGNLLVRANDLAAGIDLLERALALAEAADDPAEAAECCACLRMACFWNGEYRRGAAYCHREIAYARRCHMPSLLRHVYTFLAVFHIFRGEMEEAGHMLASAKTILEGLGSPEALAYYDWVAGSLHWVGGDYALASHQVGEAIAAFRRVNPNTVVWYLGMYAWLLAQEARREEAQACMEEMEALLATLPVGSMPAGQVLSWLGATALVLGDHERLTQIYRQLTAFRGRVLDRSIDRLLGEIETLKGAFAAAAPSLAAAEELIRREGFAWELGTVLVARANLELARGGRGSAARARALLGEAQAAFRAFGDEEDARRVQIRLRALPSQPGDRPHTPLPAGLSQREAEVLQLVAGGKSNREIAATLSLSEKTIGNHLTHIFTKIDVDNRTAATAFAIRHGLA